MDRLSDDVLVVSPSDLVAFTACRHVTWLDRLAVAGELERPKRNDEMLELLQKRGLAHEAAHLAALEAEGLQIVNVDEPAGGNGRQGGGGDRFAVLRDRREQTRAAMESGADVVFQATFFDESSSPVWRGHADFLLKTDEPSDLGPWSYEPEDTKLSKVLKAGAVIQLCSYAEQVAAVQGRDPEQVYVALGDGASAVVRLSEVSAYYRAVRQRFLDELGATEEDYPVPVDHCRLCRWAGRCNSRWDADDHLSRVAFITRGNVRALEAAGIGTLAALAAAPPAPVPAGVSEPSFARLRTQARLQHQRVPGEPPPWEFVLNDDGRVEDNMGLAALPAPDPGDLFYDIEGHPYVVEGGLEYLHGIGWVDGGEFQFDGWWAHNPRDERRVFERLIDLIVERRRQFPGMHVYHYAPYEVTAVRKLMGRYGTREDEVDDLLRNDVFVDLYRVVRQGLRVGSPSYSIKKLEPLYMREREGDIGNGGSSIIEYERWLASGDQQILDEIEAYNRDDVESTLLLRNWLEERRTQLEGTGVEVRRPYVDEEESDRTVPDDVIEALALVDALAGDMDEVLESVASSAPSALVPAGLGAAGGTLVPSTYSQAPDDSTAARWLMADLLLWHRREDKPEWWNYFDRLVNLGPDDYVEDAEVLGGLELVGKVDYIKESTVWRYTFDPEQEVKLAVGALVVDLDDARAAVEEGRKVGGRAIHAIDLDACTVDIKRGNAWSGPHPTTLIPKGPMSTKTIQQSLRHVARALLDHGVDAAGPARVSRQLLAGRLPSVAGVEAGAALRRTDESVTQAAVRVISNLDSSVLAVQGPPGAGKTHTAAEVILSLVAQGKKVGISAFTHGAITTLLNKVVELADESGVDPSIIQKVTDGKPQADPDRVELEEKADKVAQSVVDFDVIAGTTWLFAREDMRDAVDTLIVDEAGQLSLANVVAVGPACRNLVLVGDPQQLSQPSKGVHPTGAGVSALEHVLGDHATVPDERGLFLDRTWRMHPDVCEFISEQVYEGRLESQDFLAQQCVGGEGALSGSGLRWLPVEHQGNRTASPEEVDAVRAAYEELLGRPWTDKDGASLTIGTDDILVVAPYNAQVHRLAAALPTRARVGTVDKFQGQEAAVVIVSMTASSAEDVPRGMEFLYSRNRINVAVSRARALCVMVASPDLLTVECKTVNQMKLANVLCRYVEMAEN